MGTDYLIELDEKTMKAIEQLRELTLVSLVRDDGLPQWVAELLREKLDNRVIIRSAIFSMVEFAKRGELRVGHGHI